MPPLPPEQPVNGVAEPSLLELQPSATQHAEELTKNYLTSLVYLAKGIAFAERADVTLKKHVSEAELVIRKQHTREWWKELLVIFGSALVGAFVQGVVTELGAAQLNRGTLAALARTFNQHRPVSTEVMKLLSTWHGRDHESYRAIARKLNHLGIRTPLGRQWHHETVKQHLTRLPRHTH